MFVVLLNCALVKGQLNVQNKPSHSLDELSWLAGAWTGDVDGDVTEEQWLAPKAGIMVGVNRSVYRSGKVSFEFMRIAETPKGITYFASPGGRPATGFVAKEISESSAIFENLDNDFPQRVIYRRKEYGISSIIPSIRAEMPYSFRR